MANINNNKEYTVSLPFSITSFGTVNDTTIQEKIWADRVLSVVGTGIGERLLRYSFGSRTHQELFNNEESAKEGIYREINTAFILYLPLLRLRDVRFSEMSIDGKLTVEVVYALPNEQEVTTFIGQVTLQGQYPASEEL